MGLVQDRAPVVKILQEDREAEQLNDGDDGLSSGSESNADEEPPRKRSKPDQTSDKQPSSGKTGDSATDTINCTSNKVDSLVTEVTEDEVTGPAISEKIAKVLNNILAGGLNEQATKRRKETSVDPQTANCSHKLVSILRFGISLKSRHEAWMPGCKPYKTP